MGTAAIVGMIDKYTGRVRYTDVAFDGDPKTTGTILRDHYRSPDKIKDLILLGSLRSLGKSPDPSPEGTRYIGNDFTSAYIRDFDYPAHQVRDKTVSSLDEFKRGPMMSFPWDYIYLYDVDNRQWLHASHSERDPNYYRGKDAFGPLSNAIGRREIRPEDVEPFRPRSVEPYDHAMSPSIEPMQRYYGPPDATRDFRTASGMQPSDEDIEMQQSLDKARRMEQKIETLYFEGKTSEETLQIAREKVNQLIERAIAEGALRDYDDVEYHMPRMGRPGSRGIPSTGQGYNAPNFNVTIR